MIVLQNHPSLKLASSLLIFLLCKAKKKVWLACSPFAVAAQEAGRRYGSLCQAYLAVNWQLRFLFRRMLSFCSASCRPRLAFATQKFGSASAA